MDIPEQDKQALIEAARRRSQQKQGGAAFGVYPSSGKRPEKLNVSRDVNMPAQAARGWVASTLGLLGDFESLGRAGINFAFGPGGVNVDETPVLPTSEFYQEYLPGGDERPAAKFASGLGALAGGMGSTKVAGAAVKGAKATGKALGPKAAEMAESYLKKSGLAPELIAYQGSPHKFAPEPDAPFGKFKAEKIGTGEGAQAYGHGHYTAEARNVAQSYADVLASPRNRVGEGRGVYIEPSPISGGKYMLATRSEIGQPRGLAADATQFIYPEKEFSSIAAAVKFAKRKGLLSKDERPKLTAVNEDRKYVPVTKAADVAEPEYTQFIASDPGYLYTVDIPDEKVAMMLDLDRPLAEQSPEVQKALSNVSGTEYAADYFAKNRKDAPTGADMQEFLRLSGMNPPEIAAKMREAGIPGVRYLDEQSRNLASDAYYGLKRMQDKVAKLEAEYKDNPSEALKDRIEDAKQELKSAERGVSDLTRNFVIFPGEEESVKIIDRKAEGGLVQDTDAIAAKLTGMDKDKALTQALRMANAKQEAHMAAGGLAKVLKGAKAAKEAEEAAKPAIRGTYQALPLRLPRAPNLSPQELTQTAERIARQQAGEHVRKAPNKSENLAGRSMKEVERLKKLDIDIRPTKQIPTPTVVPEKKGEVRIGLPGDITVADQMLMSVNGLPIRAQQEGGALYGFGKMDLEDPAFWASNRGPAQQVQNKITDVSNLYDTPDVLAMHLAMGHDAMNFAQHFADANLRAIQKKAVNPDAAKMFNEIIRAGNPSTGQQFPNFPGIENYKKAYKALQEDPEMRKWFNDRMKKDSITEPLGLPSGKEIEYAIMEPALRNMEPSLVGLSVGRMKPGAELMPDSPHKTYSHDIPGLAIGKTRELLPIELAFPDASAHISRTNRPQDFTATIQKVFPHQVVDEQYINQLGEYYNRLKQIRGYKKGGAVKKSGLSVLNKAII